MNTYSTRWVMSTFSSVLIGHSNETDLILSAVSVGTDVASLNQLTPVRFAGQR